METKRLKRNTSVKILVINKFAEVSSNCVSGTRNVPSTTLTTLNARYIFFKYLNNLNVFNHLSGTVSSSSRNLIKVDSQVSPVQEFSVSQLVERHPHAAEEELDRLGIVSLRGGWIGIASTWRKWGNLQCPPCRPSTLARSSA